MNRMNLKKIIIIAVVSILAILVIFSIVSFIVVKVNFDDVFSRSQRQEPSGFYLYEDVKKDYDRELISFESGENTLQGYLYGAENTKGLVVVSHGLGGGADSYLPEIMYFVDNGYRVFAYDNTGCFSSEGDNCVGLVQSVLDLDAALSFIESDERFEDLDVLLYGHSWGGYAVTAIHNFDHDITASVSVAGFNDPMTMIVEWGRLMMGDFIDIERPYIYLYQKTIFKDKLDITAVDGINKTDVPILLIHGSEDELIHIDGPATVAYKEQITNPNVEYKICDKERQNDHNHLFADITALDYIDEVNEIYTELWNEYDGKIPEDVRNDYYDKIDKSRVEKLDDEFMKDVLDFYERSMK